LRDGQAKAPGTAGNQRQAIGKIELRHHAAASLFEHRTCVKCRSLRR
jgi:hypothetical protein